MRSDTQQAYAERILRVLVHVQSHLDEALEPEQLARLSHFSTYHFYRVFRGLVGESVMEHVRRLRLERAAQRLKTSPAPVTRIAFEAGYETHEAFTRAFRAMFGESPSGFRDKHRPLHYPPSPSGVHFAPDGRIERFAPCLTGESSMQVRIEQVKPMRVAFVRHIGPYEGVHETWQRLCAWAGPHGLFGPQTVCLGISHDDPDVTQPERLRYDACITVDGSVQPEGEVGVQEIAGGDYAVTTHRGPYERLGETYNALYGQWLPGSGREARPAPSFEVYRNHPETTAPENLITDIHVPLEARG